MSSNPDKNIQDKLRQFSASPNPMAWQAMEAMLDKKERRRFAFWWWTSGIAASGIIAIGLLLSLVAGVNSTSDSPLAENGTTVKGATAYTTSGARNNSATDNIAADKVAGIAGSTIETENTTQLNSTEQTNSTASEQAPDNVLTSDAGSEEAITAVAIVPATKKKISKPKRNSSIAKQNFAANSNFATNSTSTTITFANNFTALNNTAALSQNSTTGIAENEAIAIQRIESGLLPTDFLGVDIATEGASGKLYFQKGKKKLFSYSIGAQATVMATVADKNLAAKPSHSSGIMQWFGIGRYFAFNLGLTAGQTSFAASDSFGSAYSLTTLSVPVGLQLNPVTKGRVSWIVNTGVNNNFVLQQSVTLNHPPMQQQDGLTTNTPQPTLNFDNLAEAKTMALEKSVNKYHLALYAGTGIEVAINRKLNFYSSATFAMPLTAVSSDKHKLYQIGGTAGFRFKLF